MSRIIAQTGKVGKVGGSTIFNSSRQELRVEIPASAYLLCDLPSSRHETDAKVAKVLTGLDPDETYIGITEAARMLGLGKRTVRRFLDSTDKLSGFRVPGTDYRKVSLSSALALQETMRQGVGSS